MAEELSKRDYLVNGSLKGNAFGEFEEFNLGDETVSMGVKIPPFWGNEISPPWWLSDLGCRLLPGA
jgi:hypothetical protein